MNTYSSTRRTAEITSPALNSKVYGGAALTGFRYSRRLEILTRALFDGERASEAAEDAPSILDLGCGDGTWLLSVAPRVRRGLGIDLGWSGAADHWEPRENLEFRNEDFMQSALDGERFDIVTCLETLEHCPDPGQVLDRMASLVRVGGRVGVSVPIEHGLSLVVKELAAYATGYKRTGDRSGRWSFSEVLRASMGDLRAVAREREEKQALTHKGFDYREVVHDFCERFGAVRLLGTPFPLLGAACNVGIVLTGVS